MTDRHNRLDAKAVFPIGADVIVSTFGKKRGVVAAASRDGRYQVRVGTMVVSCRQEDLTAPPASERKRSTGRTASSATESITSAAGRVTRIDLHGLTVEEATARVLEAIERAVQRGDSGLEIVHGKGAGRLKSALHRLLPGLVVVRSFALDSRNPGVTVARF